MGKVHVIVGPMWGGKSTEAIRLIRRYRSGSKAVLAINHSSDVRYGSRSIITHDMEQVDCLQVADLDDVPIESVVSCDVMIIEEAQFFSGLRRFVRNAADVHDKIVYVIGLDGSAKRERLGEALDVIMDADTVEKLLAVCRICGGDAPFTGSYREIPEDGVLVGGEETYLPLCRKHWIENQ